MGKHFKNTALIAALTAALGAGSVYAHELDRDDAPIAHDYARAEADAALATNVRDALRRAPDVDASQIQVNVESGVAYLQGNVDSEEQARLAHEVAHSVPGIRNVLVNRLQVIATDERGDHYDRGGDYQRDTRAENVSPADERIHEQVHEALEHTRGIDTSDLNVTVRDGVVYLSGYIPNHSQKVYAHDVAHSVPGVREVHTGQLRISG